MRENDAGRVILAHLIMAALGSAYTHSLWLSVAKAAI
jgi:hypothetical protein